jgi:UDP-N-acetyl-D-galactosamine dehydrogenase
MSRNQININTKTIAIIGLGYVGLPLAVEFGKKHKVIGYDVNENRIYELKDGIDSTLEISKEELSSSSNLILTSQEKDISVASVFIVTVPTPINKHQQPDLEPLLNASKVVGKALKKGDIVIYESTVYPGATEEDCVPVLENFSGLVFNNDFFVGYSPERINPGDKTHTLTKILKVTSGSLPQIADQIDELYKSIIVAGTYKAPSIKIAEAAKVIENTQRDVNIGLVNELAMIFNVMNIDTEEVLKTAGTKWNFLNYKPGLVGGHCIGVDPYYLTHKAQSIGYHPKLILAGRSINDGMGKYIASELIKMMSKKSLSVTGSNILLLGLAFKENCPDIRNTKVIDIYNELTEYGAIVDCYDPWVNLDNVKNEYDIGTVDTLKENTYDAIIIAVAHREFKIMGEKYLRTLGKDVHILYDLKCILNKDESDMRL